jgi:calcium-dependent protein kinase
MPGAAVLSLSVAIITMFPTSRQNASLLFTSRCRGAQELFVAMDRNNDGCIDSNDLHAALEKVGAAIDEKEMKDLFSASDVDGTGKINYDQFIAAMLDTNRVAKRKDVVSPMNFPLARVHNCML